MVQKRQYIKFLLGVLVFAGVLVCASIAYGSLVKDIKFPHGTGIVSEGNDYPSDQKPPTVSQDIARDFTVFDEAGKAVKLSSYRGKPVVLNFWSPQCGPCLEELPAFNRLHKSYGDKIAFFMITPNGKTQGDISKIKEFIAQHQYTFPVYFDQKFSAWRAYGITHIPVTVVIRADGTIYASYIGRVPDATLEEKIKSFTT